MLEPQRRSNDIDNNPLIIQKMLDKVNDVLQRDGYVLKPIIRMKKCGFIPRFFLKKFSKYLVASFAVQLSPVKPTQKVEVKRVKKHKKGKKK